MMSKRFLPQVPKEPTQLTPPTLLPSDLKESPLLDSLGVSKKYVLNEYMKVVNQDDDLPSKLKALKPLAKEIGIDMDGTQPGGITNNIIVMPGEIVQKHALSSQIIEGDLPTPTLPDLPPVATTPKRKKHR